MSLLEQSSWVLSEMPLCLVLQYCESEVHSQISQYVFDSETVNKFPNGQESRTFSNLI